MKNMVSVEDYVFIVHWDLAEESYMELIELLRTIWCHKYGTMKTNKDCTKMELHTGGWSENEEIISALRQSQFWRAFWWKTERGGHYYFKGMKDLKGSNIGK